MNLQKLKKQTHGISVIIGALMLTLIVVGAAASFAIFTGQKQAELQQAQLERQRREQENIGIFSIETIKYDNNDYLNNINFSIGSLHTLNTMIRDISLGGKSINLFKIMRQNGTEEWWFSAPQLSNYFFYTPYKIIHPIDGELLNIEADEEWRYTRGEEIGIIDLRTGITPSPDNHGDANENFGDKIGLYSLNGGNPFVFIDSNFNWKYDNGETVISGIGNDTIGADGGLWAYDDVGQAYIFKDTKRDLDNYAYFYSPGEEVIELDADGDSIDATINRNKGYFWAVNDNGQCYLVHDTDDNDSRFRKNYDLIISPNERIHNLNLFSSPSNIQLDIDKYENIKITIENNFPTTSFEKNIDPIKFSIFTDYVNTFSKVFQIPTANVDFEIDGSELILDGSLSYIQDDENEIISYEWVLEHSIKPFVPYTFKDIDNSSTYTIDDELLNISIFNIKATPFVGQPGGLFALNSTGSIFIFYDANNNWMYDGEESEDEILNETKNIILDKWTNAEIGNKGGLFANNESNRAFTFQDFDNDWSLDLEEVINLDIDGSTNAIPNHNDVGGLYGIDSSGEEYIFDDANRNWIFDDGDTVLDWNLDGNANNADPKETNIVGIIANDSSYVPYIIKDEDNDWVYDKEENQIISGTSSSGDIGYLYHEDASGNAYMFMDLDGNWKLDTETIINDDLDGIAPVASPSIGEYGGLFSFDSGGEPFTFRDFNGNWIYDSGEILSLNPDYPDTTPAKPDPSNNIFGGIYALDTAGDHYTFIDLNGNFKYDSGEILEYDADKDLSDASPTINDGGGLYAIDSSNEPYLFIDTNTNWRFDGETVKKITGSTITPKNGDFGYLYANDTGTTNYYGFQDLNGNWSYDSGEPLSPHIGNGGITATNGNIGGLYFIDSSSNEYFFRDENENWQYDDEFVDFLRSSSPTLLEGDYAGILATDGTRNEYTFNDIDGDNRYDNETLHLNPFNHIQANNLENGTVGGLFASANLTSYPSQYTPSLLNNPRGIKKSVLLDKPSWAETETIITLTVTDKFGMIGTDSYTLLLPPNKQ